MPQLTFAKRNGIDVIVGDPDDEVPGESIVIPAHPSMLRVRDVDLTRFVAPRCAISQVIDGRSDNEIAYIAEVNLSVKETEALLETLQ